MKRSAKPSHTDLHNDEIYYRSEKRQYKSGLIIRMGAQIMRDPARFVATGLLLTALLSVAINALYLQQSKHAAPVFETASVSVAPESKPSAVAVPVPLARSTAFSTTNSPLDDTISASPGFNQPASAPITPSTVPIVQKTDMIGDWIDNSLPKPVAQNKILLAQRALAKLGYSVRPDGVNGSATQQAVEKFERENRLPIKGELTPKLLRQLSMATGIVIE